MLTGLHYRLGIEALWVALVAGALLVLLAEPDRPTAIIALVAVVTLVAYLRRRRVPSALYWTSAVLLGLGIALVWGTAVSASDGPRAWALTLGALGPGGALLTATLINPRLPGANPSAQPTHPHSALPDDRTGRALRRSWLATTAVVVAGQVLLAAAVVEAGVSEGRQEELEATGTRVGGTVVEHRDLGTIGGEHITVAYQYDGEPRRVVVNLTDNSPRYQIGEFVVVVVDPDGEHVSVLGESNDSRPFVWLFVTFLVLGFFLFVAGVEAAIQLTRRRRILTSEPWRTAIVTVAEIGPTRSKRFVLRIVEADDEHVVGVSASLWWTLPVEALRTARSASVAGAFDRHGAIRLDGSDRILSVSAPRRRWTRDLWSTELDRANTGDAGE